MQLANKTMGLDTDDDKLERAILMSMGKEVDTKYEDDMNDLDEDTKLAIKVSMRELDDGDKTLNAVLKRSLLDTNQGNNDGLLTRNNRKNSENAGCFDDEDGLKRVDENPATDSVVQMSIEEMRLKRMKMYGNK